MRASYQGDPNWTSYLANARLSVPLIPCGVIQLALVWDGKAARKGGFSLSQAVVQHSLEALALQRLPSTSTATTCTTAGCVKFFTAPALATFATHGNASVEAQHAYHRALQVLHGDRFALVCGNHSYDRAGSLLPAYLPGVAFDRTNRVRVWRLEEKRTDVNLALSMYRDACKGLYERMVLVSNDSDAEPALAAIREDFPQIQLGVVMPIRPPTREGGPRRQSGSLSRHAHWMIGHLTDAQLLDAQLGDTIPTKKKPILKPPHW
jgi:uncharacterized LabA/DUF88 family protein